MEVSFLKSVFSLALVLSSFGVWVTADVVRDLAGYFPTEICELMNLTHLEVSASRLRGKLPCYHVIVLLFCCLFICLVIV